MAGMGENFASKQSENRMSLLLKQNYMVLNKRLNADAQNGFVSLQTPPAIKGWEATASVWRDKPRPSGWFPAAAH
jgi:hypothetical protein